jgi:hypothetical protein
MKFWTPAFAGVTLQKTFYEMIKCLWLEFSLLFLRCRNKPLEMGNFKKEE